VAAESVSRIIAGSDPEHLGLVVNGLAIDEYRRRGREIPAGLARDLDDLLEYDQLPRVMPFTADTDEFRTGFDLALRDVPDDERDAYILTDLRGLTTREASGVLDTSHVTVHRRAEAARTFIREGLTT
jgi:DNA-directed RNA polymerase specialized sigma24 family protein